MDARDPRLRPPSAPLGAAPRDDDREAPAGLDGAAWLGDRYVESLSAAERSREGRFYTPRRLARLLLEHSWNPESAAGLVVDPACGAGALLTAAAEKAVTSRPPDEALRWTAQHLRGCDLDPFAVWLCNLAVGAALLPAWSMLPEAARPHLPRVARVADGLADLAPATLVVANPPFGRVRLAAAERARFADALYGHANRATLFLAQALTRLTQPGAAAAFVLPASVLGGAYQQRLRALMATTAPPAWLCFVQDRSGVFAGEVLQEAVLGVFVHGGPAREGVQCERISLNGDARRRLLTRVTLPARPSDPWLLPREPADAELLARAANCPTRLADLGWKASTGPLVWNRHRPQLYDEAGPKRVPVIWASDVRAGGIVDPSGPRRARFCALEPGQEWLVLRRPAILVQRTTAPEQPRRLVAGLLDEATLAACGGAVVVENHLNVLTWDGRGAVGPEGLLAYLNSDEADRLYRCITGSVAVSAFELHALPVLLGAGPP